VVDNNNNTVIIPVSKLKRLVAGDTAVIYFTIDASNFSGNNTLYVNVNPNNTQPEQYHFNNFLYKSFYITPDNTNPVLDVTFDGVHILNDDIVSSKPDIKVKLFDDARYNLLNDTSLLSVKLIYPDNSTHAYSFNTDTLRFTPATNVGSENAALVDFTPYLPVDGTYQLLVSGKNRSGKPAGLSQYRVQFVVKNTPMISNVFNYPNPFTTSTAFVFTLTGSEVPQDMKIEILTVTGKIVKEITKEQLGNVQIGNNITTYKWDGTDIFGAKLGNGVYLYRVVTKLNGNNLDKYTGGKGGTNTDQFFKGGYGKMYLLR
jgi:flagellar hook assembly protein FlgD